MPAPVNVKLESPTDEVPNWPLQAAKWKELNRVACGNPDFFPLTIKAAYVIGVIHDLCRSVDILLRDPASIHRTYIPAYGIFASGVELLGRCITGNDSLRGATDDLLVGFRWLKCPGAHQTTCKKDILTSTNRRSYSIETLAAWRHFAAHGQATAKGELDDIDFGVLEALRPLLRDGLEVYWNDLQQNADRCNQLARANILGLRNWPVLNSWLLFEGSQNERYPSITAIFDRFNWSI